MFKKPHHQRVMTLLSALNSDFLVQAECYFGGGTAIVLQLNEYRESVDIDFMCASRQGYRLLREAVFQQGIQSLFSQPVSLLREARADQYGIRAICLVDQVPIKFEIVNESRITLEPEQVVGIPVLCLSRVDLFAEKLLANTDRGMDSSTMSRDLIDLVLMEQHWGQIPAAAWEKVSAVYGQSAYLAWQKSKDFLRNHPLYLNECLEKMEIAVTTGEVIRLAIGSR